MSQSSRYSVKPNQPGVLGQKLGVLGLQHLGLRLLGQHGLLRLRAGSRSGPLLAGPHMNGPGPGVLEAGPAWPAWRRGRTGAESRGRRAAAAGTVVAGKTAATGRATPGAPAFAIAAPATTLAALGGPPMRGTRGDLWQPRPT